MSEHADYEHAASSASSVFKLFKWQIVSVAIYFVLKWVFVATAGTQGLISPDLSSHGITVFALGILMVPMRVMVYGLVPAFVTYKIVMLAFAKLYPREKQGL